MVAAERPSISHALKRLAHAGLVSGSTDDLHLHGTLEYQLEALFERHSSLAAQATPGDQRAG
jgi:hypothetical protein